MNKCVFLDRDGTINIDYGYVYRKDDFVFKKDVIEALRILKEKKYFIIVITNQSGIARGYYTEEDVRSLHEHVNQVLNSYGTFIDAFYYCPHHEDGAIQKYSLKCNCRKPGIDCFIKAKQDYNIDLLNSYMIGDKSSDLMAAKNAKLKKGFLIQNDNILQIVSKIVAVENKI